MLNVEKLIEGVHDYIGRALAPFAARVKALEDRAPERGEKGEPGAAGERGLQGIQGERGEKGDAGERGADGAEGVAGIAGKDGAPGIDGPTGPAGKSAYLLAVERGFSGTELQWLDSLAGKPGRDGINGKDAAPVDTAAIAREAAALVPVPKDGKPGPAGKDIDPALLNDAIDRKLADAVSKLPVAKDGRDGAPGMSGEPGPAGKDADPAIIATMVADGVAQALPGAVQRAIDAMMPELIAKAAEAVPRPRDGKDGTDGKDATVDTGAIVREVVALMPAPKDGKDGQDAEPIDIDAVVAKAVALIPVPKDGVDGSSVTLDDLRPVLEAETARWQLEFERRAADTLQRAIDNAPKPENGKDGQDGLSVEDFEVTLEGRTFIFELRRGDITIKREIKVPFPMDKGVYRFGAAYEKGDVITYGGSQWIALKDTSEKPPSDSWRLQVRKGTDGKSS